MNVAQNLESSAFFFPTRPAISEAGTIINYAELNDRANRVATGLIKMGVQPGDLVAMCLPNSAEWIFIYFGIIKTGAVAVTLAGSLTGDELTNLVQHANPRFIFAAESKLPDLERSRRPEGLEKVICSGGDIDLKGVMGMGSSFFRAIDRDRSDIAAILYTGGTTGVPKGAMVSHEHAHFSSYSIAYYERSTPKDLALCFLPFNHVFGQMHIVNSTIYSSGCLELLPAFDLDKVLEVMKAGRITKFFSVPTVYVRLLTLPDLEGKIGPLRYCFSAGASMAMETVKQWKQRTGITIAESYGMTECMPITFNHFYPEFHVVGSVGQPVVGVEVQIRDTSGNILPIGKEGEICVRGRNVMKGYLNSPEQTAETFWNAQKRIEDGWLRTGDIGILDEKGFVAIVDRLKDLIITGGENVFPREVEEALYTIPEVQECAVIGLPDKEWGEKVAAFIVPKPGETIDQDKIKSFLKTRLSGFKVPKKYVVLSEFPKSQAGKILKREVKRQFLDS
jgi:long-chain acyl-CoA synthetase